MKTLKEIDWESLKKDRGATFDMGVHQDTKNQGWNAAIDFVKGVVDEHIEREGWQDISSAPKDGECVLISLYDAAGNYKGQNVAHWSQEDEEGYKSTGHWQASSGKYGGFALYYVHPKLSKYKHLTPPEEDQ